MRKRYDSFLGSTYSSNIFYLQTTAVDRTKMSGMLEAAALWKPDEKQSFKTDLPWQPVTLSYQERPEDTVKYLRKHLARQTDPFKSFSIYFDAYIIRDDHF